ncbi:MAG TPA: SLBB domain-containing protein [Vicinamibacterales bacterium]|jgi:polysaccharide export outer membrane protein|nr:SLBB domain-containing protein [Vicinamibacterales bacterium]
MASRTIRWSVAAAVLALVVAGVTAVQARQANPKIGPRDQITVTVQNAPSLSGEYQVDAEGVFVYPPIGPIKAGGETVRDLEVDLTKRLIAADIHRSPHITVELKQTANKAVTVSGAVQNPGQVTYSGEITLFDALVRAGGPTDVAGEDVLVIPADDDAATAAGGSDVRTVNLQQLMSGNLAKADIDLHDGDRILVQRAQLVTITGYVNAPGAYMIKPGTTVQQALALAGDISEKGTTRGLRIMRKGPGDAKPRELKDVKLSDPVEPGDTIIVRKSII